MLSAASNETVKTLAALEVVMIGTVLQWSAALFLLEASVVVLQSGVMAKWLGLLVALLVAMGTLWPVTGDEESFLGILIFIGIIGFLIWALGAAISMIHSDSPSVS